MSLFITLLIKGSKINESAAYNVILQQQSTKEEINFPIFREQYRPKFFKPWAKVLRKLYFLCPTEKVASSRIRRFLRILCSNFKKLFDAKV